MSLFIGKPYPDCWSRDAPSLAWQKSFLMAHTEASSAGVKEGIASLKIFKAIITQNRQIKRRVSRGLTDSRSRPSASKPGTADESFWGLHCGYSCQSFNFVTPGHTVSFGVPNNLKMCSSCCSSESPWKMACFVTSSAESFQNCLIRNLSCLS